MRRWLQWTLVGIAAFLGFIFAVRFTPLPETPEGFGAILLVWAILGFAGCCGHSMRHAIEKRTDYSRLRKGSAVYRLSHAAADFSAVFLGRLAGTSLLLLGVLVILYAGSEILARASSGLATFFAFAPPHVSGNVIAGAVTIIAAIITIFGGRFLEAKRSRIQEARAGQSRLYAEMLDFLLRSDITWTPEQIDKLDSFRRRAILEASNRVLDALADLVVYLKEEQFNQSPEGRQAYLSHVWALAEQMRKDLGFRVSDEEGLWEAIDPTYPIPPKKRRRLTLKERMKDAFKFI